eukprot:7316943-Pyramimonas_sp.AAC.1
MMSKYINQLRPMPHPELTGAVAEDKATKTASRVSIGVVNGMRGILATCTGARIPPRMKTTLSRAILSNVQRM